MNCVSWYEAFAFCAWDEARIPTEVEWEYAAKGGAQNRLYPWGDTTPTADFAVYGCLGAGTSACAFEDILVVGSKPNGDGRFGQSDLAGSVREWVLDWMSPTVVDVIGENFAYLEESVSGRVIRSGSWATSYGENQSSNRSVALPTARNNRHGFRCARNP
jgi:formylglycine-generating enzyme required for sulfatase activity